MHAWSCFCNSPDFLCYVANDSNTGTLLICYQKMGQQFHPRRTFDPLSESPSTRDSRITMTDFRLCSTSRSHSQAGLYHCIRKLVVHQLEPTFARLRYSLGNCVNRRPRLRGKGNLYIISGIKKGPISSRNLS
jgi:hypothetical protein